MCVFSSHTFFALTYRHYCRNRKDGKIKNRLLYYKAAILNRGSPKIFLRSPIHEEEKKLISLKLLNMVEEKMINENEMNEIQNVIAINLLKLKMS